VRLETTQLADIFPNAGHVQFYGLAEKTDTEIWQFAISNDFCIVTQDADFAERSRLYGSPPKVVWLRCGNVPTNQIEALLRSGKEAIKELLSNPTFHCLELY
jgi:predicted nuclease of predicted toxin-antitoxin system